MATATYSASLITRIISSSSNAKTGYACQEFYSNTYNYVGIICFSGMALTNKVITGISITAVSQQAGYGAGHTKTVYVRKSNYQNTSASATGAGYAGDAPGTFTGSFYSNTTTVALSGSLLTNLAAYFAAGRGLAATGPSVTGGRWACSPMKCSTGRRPSTPTPPPRPTARSCITG